MDGGRGREEEEEEVWGEKNLCYPRLKVLVRHQKISLG